MDDFLSPLQGFIILTFTHGLRRGLHSFAAPRLAFVMACSCVVLYGCMGGLVWR